MWPECTCGRTLCELWASPAMPFMHAGVQSPSCMLRKGQARDETIMRWESSSSSVLAAVLMHSSVAMHS